MSKKTTTEKPTFSIKGMKLGNVRKLSDKVIAFSLLGNGLGLYNLKVVSGAKGNFIATPQTKASNGEWYNQYAVYFSDEDQKKIIKSVKAKLKEEEEDEEEEVSEEDIPF